MELIGLICAAVAILALAIGICIEYIDNNTVEYENFSMRYSKRVRIVHLADLHFPRQAVDCGELLKKIASLAPDLAVITGDLVCRNADPEASGAYAFLEQLTALCPVYFVTGNHEAEHRYIKALYDGLAARGVTVLDGSCATFEKYGRTICIAGVSEGGTPPELPQGECILLVHRPERAARLVQKEGLCPELVLAGHAHGGQFRLFGRGLYATGQGVFPKYTSGKYLLTRKTRLIVSRGIGKSRFPFRFNNRPHVPVIDF